MVAVAKGYPAKSTEKQKIQGKRQLSNLEYILLTQDCDKRFQPLTRLQKLISGSTAVTSSVCE